jgi:hypothetical protein
MNRNLTPAELQLLSRLADGRLLASEIDPELIVELHRDGLVQQVAGRWRVSVKGALASMGAAPA